MAQFSSPAQIGHNSVQIPHDGVLHRRGGADKVVTGARFKAQSFFRPTVMSSAMADAGIIPAGHLIREVSMTGLLRHKRDHANTQRSVHVAF